MPAKAVTGRCDPPTGPRSPSTMAARDRPCVRRRGLERSKDGAARGAGLAARIGFHRFSTTAEGEGTAVTRTPTPLPGGRGPGSTGRRGRRLRLCIRPVFRSDPRPGGCGCGGPGHKAGPVRAARPRGWGRIWRGPRVRCPAGRTDLRRSQGDAVEFFLTGIGLPPEAVDGMRQAPSWPSLEAMGHTLMYESEISDDSSIVSERLPKVKAPTLVIDSSGSSPDLERRRRLWSMLYPTANVRPSKASITMFQPEPWPKPSTRSSH
jgi:hypothetical protein